MAHKKKVLSDDPMGDLLGNIPRQERKESVASSLIQDEPERPDDEPKTGPRGGTTSIYKNEKTGTELARMTVYLSPDVQRAVKQAALDRGISANTLIQNAIKKELGLS